MPGLESIQCSGRFRFNVPDGWVHVRLQLSDAQRLICLASRGKLLTHPQFSAAVSLAPPAKTGCSLFAAVYRSVREFETFIFGVPGET